MWYFRLDRSAKLALVGAALAAAPGCYLSYSDEDAGDADARDADADARDADADAPWEGVDPAPYPMCTSVEGYSMDASTAESATDYAVAEVRLGGYYDPDGSDECAAAPCLDVAVESSRGTVSDIRLLGTGVARFRYTNPALTWGEPPVRLDLSWRLSCQETSPWPPDERTVTGTAWACRDDTFRLVVVSDPDDCATVVDVAPPPMPRAEAPRGDAATGPLQLHATPRPDGSWLLDARGATLPGTVYRWLASGGTLRRLSDSRALFAPAPEASVHLVQVAAFTDEGVAVQVFRRQRG